MTPFSWVKCYLKQVCQIMTQPIEEQIHELSIQVNHNQMDDPHQQHITAVGG